MFNWVRGGTNGPENCRQWEKACLSNTREVNAWLTWTEKGHGGIGIMGISCAEKCAFWINLFRSDDSTANCSAGAGFSHLSSGERAGDLFSVFMPCDLIMERDDGLAHALILGSKILIQETRTLVDQIKSFVAPSWKNQPRAIGNCHVS